MLGYLSNAAKNGYAGTKGRAKQDAKKGNQKAIATLKAEVERERTRNQGPEFDRMRDDSRSDQEVEDDLDAISQEVGQTAQAQAEKGFTDMSAFGPNDDSSPDSSSPGGGSPGSSSPGGGSPGSQGPMQKGGLVNSKKPRKGLAGRLQKRSLVNSKKPRKGLAGRFD
jgi:hypothetical protein